MTEQVSRIPSFYDFAGGAGKEKEEKEIQKGVLRNNSYALLAAGMNK